MSKRLLFDFACPGCGILFEDLIYSFEQEAKCPNCGAQAKKVLSAPHIGWRQMGYDKDFPTAAGKWTKMQWEKARRTNADSGTPNLKEF